MPCIGMLTHFWELGRCRWRGAQREIERERERREREGREREGERERCVCVIDEGEVGVLYARVCRGLRGLCVECFFGQKSKRPQHKTPLEWW